MIYKIKNYVLIGVYLISFFTFSSIGHAQDFSFDNKTQEILGILNGNTEMKLVGKLTDSKGKRTILLYNKGFVITVAKTAWNLPPVGAIDNNDNLLICWNQLTGNKKPGKKPKLFCRQGTSEYINKRRFIAAPRGSWLRDIEINADGNIELSYYKTKSGQLFGSAKSGDGAFKRVLINKKLSRPKSLSLEE